MSLIPGWTDDELRKKYALEDSLKKENDRILKEQKEENDRLIDALTPKKTTAEIAVENEEMMANFRAKMERNAINNEKDELNKLIKTSNIFTKAGKVLLSSRIIKSLIQSATIGLIAFVVVGLFFSLIYLIFKVDLIVIVLILVAGAFLGKFYSNMNDTLTIFRDAKQIQKTKVYETIMNVIENQDLNNFQAVFVSHQDVVFHAHENQDLSQFIFFDNLGYSDLSINKQLVLARLIEKALQKHGATFNLDADLMEYPSDDYKLLPYNKRWTCKLSLWNKKYQQKQRKNLAETFNNAKKERNAIAVKHKEDIKQGKIW